MTKLCVKDGVRKPKTDATQQLNTANTVLHATRLKPSDHHPYRSWANRIDPPSEKRSVAAGCKCRPIRSPSATSCAAASSRDQRRASRAQARHQSQPSAVSATPATRNEGACRQAPRLPRGVTARPTAPKPRPSAPPGPAQCHKSHACHAKRWWMSPSQRLPHQVRADVAKCHACHANRRWMSCVTKIMCERECVTKMVCERECVKQVCVKESV